MFCKGASFHIFSNFVKMSKTQVEKNSRNYLRKLEQLTANGTNEVVQCKGFEFSALIG
jgi:hypothetical protein